MKFLYTTLFSLLFLTSQAQLNQIYVEEIVHDGIVGTDDLSGYTSYRVFAQCLSPLDAVIEVTGEDAVCTSSVCSTGDWFNSNFGGNEGGSAAQGFWSFTPSVEFDSYYTIGLSSGDSMGIPVNEDNDGDGFDGHTAISGGTLNSVGQFTNIFTSAPSGGCIVDISGPVGGAWFSLPGEPNTYGVGVSNSVMLGQFTTNGSYNHQLNTSIIPNGGSLITYTHCNNPEIPNLIYDNGGCTDSAACNYDSEALDDDGSCYYPGDQCSDADFSTINDTVQDDCSCLGEETGCADSEAVNYNPNVSESNIPCEYTITFSVNMQYVTQEFTTIGLNGTLNGWCGDCILLELIQGSTYGVELVLQEGTYEYKYATDNWSFQEDLTPGSECTITTGEFTNRLLQVSGNMELPVYCWGSCEDCGGCMDPTACNYDPEAIIDGGNCSFIGDVCNDLDETTANDLIDENCECVGQEDGCTDTTACNYNANAVLDDGTCVYPGDSCDDGNVGTNNDTFQSDCSCQGQQIESGLNQLIVEEIVHDGSTGVPSDFITYRVFAQCGNPLDNVIEVTGEDATCPASVCSTGDWYNPQGSGDAGNSMAQGFWAFIQGLEFDTYYSIGFSSGETYGIPHDEGVSANGYLGHTSANGGMLNAAGEWTTTFTEGVSGECIVDLSGPVGGTWFALPGEANGFGVGVDNSVLLGQFTTNGTFSYQLNVSVIPAAQSLETHYHCQDDTPGLIYNGQNYGCMDSAACNFDPNALVDLGNCNYIGDSCDDFDNESVNDTIDANCDCVGVVFGCTDVTACNYDENATDDDGTCLANVAPNDEFSAATELTVFSAEETCVLVEGNTFCSTDSPESESVRNDVWYSIEVSSPMCVLFTASNSQADNDLVTELYDSNLNLLQSADDTFTGGSEIIGEQLSAGTTYYFNVAGWNGGFGTFELCVQQMTVEQILSYGCGNGCTDSAACNYDLDATLDNGTCFSIGDSCNDNDPETTVDVIDENCNCSGIIEGCIDPIASNYDATASLDDGSCCYNHFIEIILYDGFGDGGMEFTLSDNNNTTIDSGSLTNGFGPESFTTCFDEPSCVLLNLSADVFFLEPSAEVYVDGELVFEHQAGDDFNQYPILINIGDNPDCEIFGCTDDTACNYLGLATDDDGSCEFESCVGCSIEGAANYSELVTQDDGSCYWEATGVVFIDDNYNGIQDPFEMPLPYQQVSIEPGGLVVITDDNGAFSFSNLDQGTYYVSVNYAVEWSNYTTDIQQTMVLPQNGSDPIYFGVTNESVPSPSACVDFYQWGFGVPCNDVLNFNICYRNMSPYPISGVVEVVLDPLVSYNSSFPSNATVDGNTVSWEFTNLGSWVMNFDDIIINTPDETQIGEYMTNSVTIYAEWEGELIALTEQTITQEVTCAYDPNDITGIPEGYTDAHLVLPTTRMEYLIRFQNTGNAPAGTVRVVDTLDVDMDWDSFSLIANSHSVMTTIDQASGEVEFLFENINLPDSVANEPESHGMVSFQIDFAEDAMIGEEINQTAHIFFDNNPAVVTNTTWHTLHQCGGEGEFEASATEICVGEEISFTSTYPHVEDYQWNLNAVGVGDEESHNQQFDEAGEFILQLVSENPICEDATSQIITVHDLPVAQVMENGAMLTATPGESYQWFLNDEPIEGATDQIYEAIEDGTYHVVVTNENNCSQQSLEVMIVNVSELLQPTIVLYPNPMTSVATLQIETSEKKTVTLTDSQGRTVRNWQNITDQSIEIQKRELASGTYYVNVLFADGQLKTMALVMR